MKKKQQLKEYDTLAQSIFYEMFGNPIDNEKGWERERLGNIGGIIAGSTPSTTDETKAMIFDSYFDPYRGVIASVRVFSGEITKKDVIKYIFNL